MESGIPSTVGIMELKSANQTILEASQLPTPRPLWKCFWYEGELSCLFADSNLGKSILAVQIAESIAKTDIVFYFDLELSDKQFQLRYTGKDNKLYQFPDNLYRVAIDRNALLDTNFENAIIESMERMASETSGKIFIIDNLTYLCSAMEKGDAAGQLMIKLNNLKMKYSLSMLIVAHTPKRFPGNPITPNDLSGSKRLYNFFDSVFAIGMCETDNSLRYIKQLKVRYGKYTHDADNVIVYEIDKVDSFLKFLFVTYGKEKEYLKELADDVESELEKRILSTYQSTHQSYRKIADDLGTSKSKVERVISKYRKLESASVSQVSHSNSNGTVGTGGTEPETVQNTQESDLSQSVPVSQVSHSENGGTDGTSETEPNVEPEKAEDAV